MPALPLDPARYVAFPTIWAQNIKDVVLHHAGPPVTAIPAIAEQASKDLGFTVQMQASENADLLNRFLSQSSSIDCADISIVYMRYLIGRNVLQAIPLSKFKYWDQTIPAVHQRRVSGRAQGASAGHHANNGSVCNGCDAARKLPAARKPNG